MFRNGCVDASPWSRLHFAHDLFFCMANVVSLAIGSNCTPCHLVLSSLSNTAKNTAAFQRLHHWSFLWDALGTCQKLHRLVSSCQKVGQKARTCQRQLLRRPHWLRRHSITRCRVHYQWILLLCQIKVCQEAQTCQKQLLQRLTQHWLHHLLRTWDCFIFGSIAESG